MRTVETIEAELAAVNAERDTLAAKARQLSQELSEAKAHQSVADTIAGMTETERTALAQIVGATSVPSAEAFGIPS